MQAIIDINKYNIETLKKFQDEKNEVNFIETSEYLTIPIICEKNLYLYREKAHDEIKDVEYFIKEFGIETIQTIRIVNNQNFGKSHKF